MLRVSSKYIRFRLTLINFGIAVVGHDLVAKTGRGN